jgi:high affinity sulfate transporter 1
VPIYGWIRTYERRWLSADVLGGLTAGAVVIPQAMAYASIAGLPVQVGLYTCMTPMLVYALLGGARTLSMSTTSTVAMLTASTLISANLAGNGAGADDLATLTLLVGIILVLARLLRLSSLIDNISSATLTGIKFGVGLTVAASQLGSLLGVVPQAESSSFIGQMRAVGKVIGDTSATTVVFSAVLIGALLVLGHVAPKVPAPLIAVVGSIFLVAVASLDEHGIALITPVPSGLPKPVLPAFDHVNQLLPGALAIAVMCYLETVSVGRSMRRKAEPAIDSDTELTANALSCVVGAFFRAMPSAGGFSQTAINKRSGARTQVSELVTIALAVAAALFLGDVLSDLPKATLSALVIVAVLGLIQPAEMVRLWRLDRLSFWVAVLTAVSGLLFGLLLAVLVGVLATLFLVLHELGRVDVTELRLVDDDLRPASPDVPARSGLLVLRIDAPLYTANVRHATQRLVDAVDARQVEGDPMTVVLDLSFLGMLSVTVLSELREVGAVLRDRGCTLQIAGLQPRALEMARQLPRWHELEDDGRIFTTSLAAVRAFERHRINE